MEKRTVQKPCMGCVYFKECGETMRTAPCAGRKTKSEKKREQKKRGAIANIEITAYKDGERRVWYKTEKLYSGIIADLHDALRAAGYTKINLRII